VARGLIPTPSLYKCHSLAIPLLPLSARGFKRTPYRSRTGTSLRIWSRTISSKSIAGPPAEGHGGLDAERVVACSRSAPRLDLTPGETIGDTTSSKLAGMLKFSAEAIPNPTGLTRGSTDAAKAWEEWEIPRETGAGWPDEAKRLHAEWWQARIARQKEIDASIAAKAEFEYLYDKPYPDPSRIRVAGPFTVESLSPHRFVPATSTTA